MACHKRDVFTGARLVRRRRVLGAGTAIGAFLAFGLSPLVGAPAANADGFDLENLEVSAGDEDPGGDVTSSDVDDAPIVRFVNKVMVDAIKKGASDIHFEPYEKHFRIRLRQDGVLTEIARPPVALAMKVSAPLNPAPAKSFLSSSLVTVWPPTLMARRKAK